MASWIDVNTELPPANRVVDVCVELSHGRVTLLRGYRLGTRAQVQSMWLNATTHQPFPAHWRISKWRGMNGESVNGEPLRMVDVLQLRQRA
jgi:hypothetical protein